MAVLVQFILAISIAFYLSAHIRLARFMHERNAHVLVILVPLQKAESALPHKQNHLDYRFSAFVKSPLYFQPGTAIRSDGMLKCDKLLASQNVQLWFACRTVGCIEKGGSEMANSKPLLVAFIIFLPVSSIFSNPTTNTTVKSKSSRRRTTNTTPMPRPFTPLEGTFN